MVGHQYKDEYPDGIGQYFWQTFVIPTVREIKGNKCEECGSTENLDIHHTDYDKVVLVLLPDSPP